MQILKQLIKETGLFSSWSDSFQTKTSGCKDRIFLWCRWMKWNYQNKKKKDFLNTWTLGRSANTKKMDIKKFFFRKKFDDFLNKVFSVLCSPVKLWKKLDMKPLKIIWVFAELSNILGDLMPNLLIMADDKYTQCQI